MPEPVEPQVTVALEAQLQGAVQEKDFGRASALQSEISAARDAVGCGVHPLPAACREKLSAASQAHGARTALEGECSEAFEFARLVALEAQLSEAVQDKDFRRAYALHS